MPIALHFAARSDLGLGPKARNEDSGYAGPNLLVLADGMGGHAAGDVASSMIVGELAPLDDEVVGADQAIRVLQNALRRANTRLRSAIADNEELAGMGSTTIALLRAGSKIALAHIGDSRAFMLRDGTLTQITKDHSFVQQLVDEGRITREEASRHPQRSIVTRVMTGQPDDEPDTSLREARVGDRFLLCSDGLSDFVGADIIEEILTAAATPAEAAERCIEVALKAHTRDNVTVIVAEVESSDSATPPPTTPQIVGAAQNRLRARTRAIPTSPAAKAAALSREATGRADEEDPGEDDEVQLAEEDRRGPRRHRGLRRGLGGLVVLAVLLAGGYAAYAWSQRQYFVGAEAGRVTIFRGVSQDLGPISLSHVELASEVPVAELPSDVQGSVSAAIPARSLAEAMDKVEVLRSEASRCRALAQSGTPCGDTPVPEPTTSTATPSSAPSGIPATRPSPSPSTTAPAAARPAGAWVPAPQAAR